MRAVSRAAMRAAALLALLAVPAGAEARTWTVDPERSSLGFEGTESGTVFRGRFERWTAEIAYDPADPAAARVVVRVDTASAATGERRRDEAIPTEDWLSARAFPEAVFRAEGFRPAGAGRYEADGTLSLRGAEHPATLEFALDVRDGTARALGGTTLVRTRFGVGQGQWSSPRFVGVEVRVVFDIAARAAE